MPLLKGSSQQVEEQNFHEFRHGKTFAHTAAKFGKARAMAQMEAVVLKSAGKSSGSSFAGKKPYGKSAGSTGKPASTFDKFKDNKKPFGKRAPTRKFKPEKGESAG